MHYLLSTTICKVDMDISHYNIFECISDAEDLTLLLIFCLVTLIQSLSYFMGHCIQEHYIILQTMFDNGEAA